MKRKVRSPESGRRLPLSQAEGNGNGETISVTCLAPSSPQGAGLLCFSEPVDETASFSLSSLLTFVSIKVTSTCHLFVLFLRPPQRTLQSSENLTITSSFRELLADCSLRQKHTFPSLSLWCWSQPINRDAIN